MTHRIAIRWWKHRCNWRWGLKHLRGEYRKLDLGPLEVVLRSKQRARRLIDDGPTGDLPSTDSTD